MHQFLVSCLLSLLTYSADLLLSSNPFFRILSVALIAFFYSESLLLRIPALLLCTALFLPSLFQIRLYRHEVASARPENMEILYKGDRPVVEYQPLSAILPNLN